MQLFRRNQRVLARLWRRPSSPATRFRWSGRGRQPPVLRRIPAHAPVGDAGESDCTRDENEMLLSPRSAESSPSPPHLAPSPLVPGARGQTGRGCVQPIWPTTTARDLSSVAHVCRVGGFPPHSNSESQFELLLAVCDDAGLLCFRTFAYK